MPESNSAWENIFLKKEPVVSTTICGRIKLISDPVHKVEICSVSVMIYCRSKFFSNQGNDSIRDHTGWPGNRKGLSCFHAVSKEHVCSFIFSTRYCNHVIYCITIYYTRFLPLFSMVSSFLWCKNVRRSRKPSIPCSTVWQQDEMVFPRIKSYTKAEMQMLYWISLGGTCGTFQEKLIKDVAYNSLVRPKLVYASPAWDPYYQKDQWHDSV